MTNDPATTPAPEPAPDSAPTPRRWRWYSTPESAERGEISVLAVVETMIAMGLAIWAAVEFRTTVHIVVGTCLAPLLLLRTPMSVLLGLSSAPAPFPTITTPGEFRQ